MADWIVRQALQWVPAADMRLHTHRPSLTARAIRRGEPWQVVAAVWTRPPASDFSSAICSFLALFYRIKLAVLCASDGACLELVVCIVILCFLFIMNTIYNALCDVALLLFIMHIIQKSLRDVALLLLIYTSPCPPSQPLPNLHFYYWSTRPPRIFYSITHTLSTFMSS